MTDSAPKISKHERVMSWYAWTDEQAARIAAADGNFEKFCYDVYDWTYEQVANKEIGPKEVRESAEIHTFVEQIISELEAEYQARTAE